MLKIGQSSKRGPKIMDKLERNIYLALKRVDEVKLNMQMWGSDWLYKNL